MPEGKSSQILGDHKKRGARFVPPFLQLGTFHDAKWRHVIVPEILWLAFLVERHGNRRGAELAVAVAKAATAVFGKGRFFALTSGFAVLTDAQKVSVRDSLRASGELDEVADGLLPLLVFYPECPLCYLFDGAVTLLDHPQADRARLKTLLGTMYDRTSKEATWAQAHAAYIAFLTGKLSVHPATSLANFPAIESYPATEESRKVAAAVRCAISALANESTPTDYTWPRYFWSRGFALERCDLSAIHG